RIVSAPCSAKLSAQSPPWSRKPLPSATLASEALRRRASPAKTSGGNFARRSSVAANAARSGESGTCWMGLSRQLLGVQVCAMMLTCPKRLPEPEDATHLEDAGL